MTNTGNIPNFVAEHIASVAVKNEDLEVLMNLIREGHSDIVKSAIRNRGR